MKRIAFGLLLNVVFLAVSPPGARGSEAPFEKGLVLGLYSSDRTYAYGREIREIAAMGADAVCLIARGYMQSPTDTFIEVDLEGPPSPDRVRSVIRDARSKGLQVLLMPIVLLRNPPTSSDWRGNIRPGSWEEWFESYRAFILFHAKLAQDAGATSLSVGSELCSAEGHTENWVKLIADIRNVFHGPLLYSANWDHYESIEFLGELDFLGVNGYEELTRPGEEPSMAEMRRVWAETRDRFLAWQERWGKPLVLTEVGYPSQKNATAHPWNYHASEEVDLVIQDQAYQVVFDTWRGEERLAALFIFDWWGRGGSKDTGYTPRRKPAEKRLRAWLAED